MSDPEFKIPKDPIVSPALVKVLVGAVAGVVISVAAQYGFELCPAAPPCAEQAK